MKNQIVTQVLSKALKMLVILSVMFYTLPSLAQSMCSAHFQAQKGYTLNSENFTAAMNSPSTTYTWNFGDGSNGTKPNTSHTYAAAGTYVVCLAVHDSSSKGVCNNSWCDTIGVNLPPPPPPSGCDAHFNFKPGFVKNSLNFSAAHNPPGSKYSWDFGDGNTGTGMNTTHTFADTGKYVVCLTVTDSLATCTDTHCDTVRVGIGCQPPHPPKPTPIPCNAHFKFHPDSVLYGVRFSSPLNGPNATYSWDFGDGNTSTSKNPINVYASTGVYYVCLTVTDSACNNTWCDSVHVNNPPPPPPPACNAHFKYSGDSTNTVRFFNAPNSQNATYAWDFGDGNTGTGSNPTNTYTSQGVYYVCLTVTDSTSAGTCTNTWCDSVRSDKHWKLADPDHVSCIRASIYPNPLSENATIHVENTTGSVTLKVMELNGRVSYTKQIGNGDFQLNKENLGPGIYFYEIKDDNGATQGKLIVH